MTNDTESIESIRAGYRPDRIKTLFVGESAPHSGDFFYCGNTAMLRNMRLAVETSLGRTDDFLKTFKAYGWYLRFIAGSGIRSAIRESFRILMLNFSAADSPSTRC
jgi:hypothetical protein